MDHWTYLHPSSYQQPDVAIFYFPTIVLLQCRLTVNANADKLFMLVSSPRSCQANPGSSISWAGRIYSFAQFQTDCLRSFTNFWAFSHLNSWRYIPARLCYRTVSSEELSIMCPQAFTNSTFCFSRKAIATNLQVGCQCMNFQDLIQHHMCLVSMNHDNRKHNVSTGWFDFRLCYYFSCLGYLACPFDSPLLQFLHQHLSNYEMKGE